MRTRPAFHLGESEVADLLARYVPVRNHDQIVKALDAHRAVAVIGPPSHGRETAGIAALHQLGTMIRRFSGEEEIHAKPGCGYLTRAADEAPSRLRACFDAVRAAGGHLVVTADEAEREALAAYLTCVTVEPPDPVEVYRRRLVVRGHPEKGWPHWDEAPALLDGGLPADASRLADLVEAAGAYGGDIAWQRVEVARAYRGWAGELREWFTEHPDAHERALLVAAAVLAPAEEKDVYSIAASLARRLDVKVSGAGLVWCPVTGLRELLGAAPNPDLIEFHRLGFADAALRHVLTDYPLSRPDVFSWLAALPADDAVPRELRRPLAETFATLTAEHGTPGQIAGAARDWAEAGLADLAFITLSRTCLDPRVGGGVRGFLDGWSRDAHTPQALKLTVARVCEPLGQAYPPVALAWLRNLATHDDGQVLQEVITAALGLVGRGLRPEVLAAAVAWSAGTGRDGLSGAARRRRTRAGALLFLRLAARTAESGLPEILDGPDPCDPGRCAPAWRAVLHDRASRGDGHDTMLAPAVGQWLDTALLRPRLRGRITAAFVEAARVPGVAGPVAAEIMINLARAWAAGSTDPVRREIKEAVVIPLTTPWPLRLLKVSYVRVRGVVTNG